SHGPLPASRKIYLRGTIHPSICVPAREIQLTPTRLGVGPDERVVPNSPQRVYDSSGPYTDASYALDLRKGLEPIRSPWIQARRDVEELAHVSSEYGRARLTDEKLSGIRFRRTRNPCVARPGRAVTQMHYAKKGIITPEMEFIALRENQYSREGG